MALAALTSPAPSPAAVLADYDASLLDSARRLSGLIDTLVEEGMPEYRAIILLASLDQSASIDAIGQRIIVPAMPAS